MLRFNSSTVLKLYAITRHIQEPGAVIFSSDDLLLQLNQTNLEQLEKQYAVSPLKHPKLARKLFNKQQAQIKNTTVATKDNSSNSKPIRNQAPIQQNNQNEKFKTNSNNNVIVSNGLSNMKKLKNRKKIMNMNNNINENVIENNVNANPIDMNPEKSIYNQMIAAKQSPLNDLDVLDDEIVNERQKELKDFILANRERFGAVYGSDREQEPEQPNNIEEYDGFEPNYRGQYSNNRDIRSKQEFGKSFFYHYCFFCKAFCDYLLYIKIYRLCK